MLWFQVYAFQLSLWFNWWYTRVCFGSIETGGSFQYFFYPYLGKWTNLTNIFEMGWNHHLGKDSRYVLWIFVKMNFQLTKFGSQKGHHNMSNFAGMFNVRSFEQWKKVIPNVRINVCLNPPTSPEEKVFRGSFQSHRSSPGMTGGFWMFRACSVRSFGYYWVDPRNVTYPDTQCMVYLPRFGWFYGKVGKWRFGRIWDMFFIFERVIFSFHIKFRGSRYQPKKTVQIESPFPKHHSWYLLY